MSLYDILKEVAEDDLYKDDLSAADIEEIGKIVEEYGRKKLGTNYDKLEDYVKSNSDDKKVKEFVRDALEKVDISDIPFIEDDDFDDEEEKKAEMRRNEKKQYYRVIKLLDEELSKIDYDPVWADLEGIKKPNGDF